MQSNYWKTYDCFTFFYLLDTSMSAKLMWNVLGLNIRSRHPPLRQPQWRRCSRHSNRITGRVGLLLEDYISHSANPKWSWNFFLWRLPPKIATEFCGLQASLSSINNVSYTWYRALKRAVDDNDRYFVFTRLSELGRFTGDTRSI